MATPICLCGALIYEEHSAHCPFPCFDKDEEVFMHWKKLRDKSILNKAYEIVGDSYGYEEEKDNQWP